MSFPTLRLWIAFVLVFAVLAVGKADNATHPPEDDGGMVVVVRWGDLNSTLATDVYVEAYGFGRKYNAEKSIVLKMLSDGRYAASLSPGVYDVFVSEGTSIPQCKRMVIGPGHTTYWAVQLEIDHANLEK